MKRLINNVVTDLKKDKTMYISLIIVLLISLIFGMFFITILSSTDKTLVKDYISVFFNSISEKTYEYNYFNNLLINISPILIILILGFSIIGMPLSIIILFYKGFTLSFTITSLIYTYKIKGILISTIYIFPHLIINLILYYICTYYSFKLSGIILNNIINRNYIKLNNYIKKNLFITIISILIILVLTLIETYLMPLVIKLFI